MLNCQSNNIDPHRILLRYSKIRDAKEFEIEHNNGNNIIKIVFYNYLLY